MTEDRVIVITGGASGIGKETAYKLANEGVKIVIADFNEASINLALPRKAP